MTSKNEYSACDQCRPRKDACAMRLVSCCNLMRKTQRPPVAAGTPPPFRQAARVAWAPKTNGPPHKRGAYPSAGRWITIVLQDPGSSVSRRDSGGGARSGRSFGPSRDSDESCEGPWHRVHEPIVSELVMARRRRRTKKREKRSSEGHVGALCAQPSSVVSSLSSLESGVGKSRHSMSV